jgi:hypothetical protein
MKNLYKTGVWDICSKSSGCVLGQIRWYGPWRQYCLHTNIGDQVIFNEGCLTDIIDFMKQLKEERAKEKLHEDNK